VIRRVTIDDVTIEWDDDEQWLRTTLADGAVVHAVPNYDRESVRRAEDLGYATTWEMSRDHEILHTLLCALHGSKSVVMDHVAHERQMGPETAPLAGAEERWVLSVQRTINKERPPTC
jgi:hypothetical protein